MAAMWNDDERTRLCTGTIDTSEQLTGTIRSNIQALNQQK